MREMTWRSVYFFGRGEGYTHLVMDMPVPLVSEGFVFPVTFSSYLSPPPLVILVFYSRVFPLCIRSNNNNNMAQQQQQAQQPQAQAAPAPAPAAPAQRAPVPRQWATPEKFNGGVQDRWESWWLQFEQLALVNAWTPQETVQFLPLALKGEALLQYYSLPQANRQGQLAPLAQSLQARFAPPQRG
eukprot:scpid10941/ scgid9066/ 